VLQARALAQTLTMNRDRMAGIDFSSMHLSAASLLAG
jgi:hypothetical protein